MLGLVLLVPYFLWMLGRSLADLPLGQRVLSVLLRIAFVALLALGLARLAKTATTAKVCTVYLVDVSESVPDAALADAEAAIQAGLDAKPADGLVRVVTFARRPRVIELADNGTKTPPIVRHEPLARTMHRLPRAAPVEAAARARRGDRHRERDGARLRPLPCRLPAPRGHPL